MRRGSNLPAVGTYDQTLVLDLIRRSPDGISRIELAARTGLSAQTLSNVARRLVAEGWVREVAASALCGGTAPGLSPRATPCPSPSAVRDRDPPLRPLTSRSAMRNSEDVANLGPTCTMSPKPATSSAVGARGRPAFVPARRASPAHHVVAESRSDPNIWGIS